MTGSVCHCTRRIFYKDDLEVVDGLVKRAKKRISGNHDAYSPYMCARFASEEKITEHIRENPEKAKEGNGNSYRKFNDLR